jgi:hypothetical protein
MIDSDPVRCKLWSEMLISLNFIPCHLKTSKFLFLLSKYILKNKTLLKMYVYVELRNGLGSIEIFAPFPRQ